MRPFKFTFRIIAVALAAILLGAMAWTYRVQILAALSPAQPAVAPPIVFDNGTVREPRTPVMPEGVARKCVSAKDILYTDRGNPQGYTEAKIERAA